MSAPSPDASRHASSHAGRPASPQAPPHTPDVVRYASAGGVATLTLDRPEHRNALSAALVAQLVAGLDRAAADPGVRAVVLDHTGPTFCAGADLREAAEGGMREGARHLLHLLRRVADLPLPVVGRLHGGARAGGLGLVAACDVAVAPAGTTFAFTEVRLGLAPAIISLTVLPRLDRRAADRYLLTGAAFDGAEAARIGLLTAAPPDAVAVDETVAAVLDDLRRCSRQGLAETKRLTAGPVRRALERHGGEMVALSAELFGSEEAAEGMRAFAERRDPRWVVPAG